MALSIQVAGASFTNVVASLSLPDRTGLVGEWTLGTDEAKSIINRANPSGPTATVVGAPTYGDGYARVRSSSGSDGFNTGVALPNNATIIVAWKKNTGCPVLFGSNVGAFEGFTNYGSAPLLYNSQGGVASSVADISVPSHTDYSFMVGILPLGGLGKIYIYAADELTTNTAEVAGGASRTGASLLFGTTMTNGGVGIADVAYGAVFARLLSDDEIAAAYASVKAYLALRELVVS